MPEHVPQAFPFFAGRAITHFPKWLYAGIVCIVICVVSLIALRNTDHERQQMIGNLKDRADVLIWALEGAARSMGNMGQNPLPALLEEIGDQSGVAYIAICDGQGHIRIHSDDSKTGTVRDLPPLPGEAAHDPPGSRGMFITVDEKSVYEVCKAFTPHQGGTKAQGRRRPRSGAMRGAGMMPRWDLSPADGGSLYIAVGMDASDFDVKLRSYIAHTVVMAALIATAGLAGIALLFFFQSYKRSRRMLEDTQALAAQVVNNLPVGLVATDLQGTISLCNRHGEHILGLSHGEKERRTLCDITLFDWQALTAELDAGRLIVEKELDVFASKTKTIPVGISAAKLTDSEGGKSGYLFILRDLGEVRRLQKQLKLNERLSALGNLAAGVAHEIRNPLSSIKGYATYLAETTKEDKMAHATGMMLIQETDRLNRVVSDLLSVAKPLDLHLQPAVVTDLLQQAMRLIRPEAEENKIAVHLALPAGNGHGERRIMIDADRLTQALLNLLVNAVQATAAGGSVQLALEEAQMDGGAEALAISVSDTGRGIAPQDMASLFTPYFTTKASGTGLGLTITQQIIEQHGGEIKVYSQPDKGATFTILLPLVGTDQDRA